MFQTSDRHRYDIRAGEFADEQLERRYRLSAHHVQARQFGQFGIVCFIATVAVVVGDNLFAPYPVGTEWIGLVQLLLVVFPVLFVIAAAKHWSFATMDGLFLVFCICMIADSVLLIFLFQENPLTMAIRLPLFAMIANVVAFPRIAYRWIINIVGAVSLSLAFWVFNPDPIETAPIFTTILMMGFAFGHISGIWMGHLRREEFARAEDLQIANRELLRSHAEVLEAGKSKAMFLANVSHELRTPLNAILGFSDMLRHQVHGPVGGAKNQEYLEDIQNSGQHLLELIDDLLDLNRLEAGKADMAPEPVRVATECDDWIKEVTASFHSVPGPDLQRGQIDDVIVSFDRRALRQIIVNLLGNARKYAGADARVVLTCMLHGDGCAITVADTGRGMAPESIAAVMKPFEQVDALTSRQSDGWGLGLPLARALAEANGARLHLESARGLGTKAILTLPAALMAQPDAQHSDQDNRAA